MDPIDGREGEVAVSRERLTEIAVELARRAQPEYVKARAQEVADDLKLKAKDAAQAKVDELKDRARVAAWDKVDDVKEMAMQQTRNINWLGALIGAGVGVAVTKLIRDRRAASVEYRGFGPYSGYREVGYGFEGNFDVDRGASFDAGGKLDDVKQQASAKFEDVKSQATDKIDDVKMRAGAVVDDVKGRASDIVDSARGTMSDMAGKISAEAHELRERVPTMGEMRTKVRGAMDNDPIIVGIGALAFGAIAGLMLPVSDAEKQAYSKVRVAAQEKLQEAGGMIHEKLEDVAQQLQGAGDKVMDAAEFVGGSQQKSQQQQQQPRQASGDGVGQSMSGSRGDQELTADGSGEQLADQGSDEGFANHPHVEGDDSSLVH